MTLTFGRQQYSFIYSLFMYLHLSYLRDWSYLSLEVTRIERVQGSRVYWLRLAANIDTRLAWLIGNLSSLIKKGKLASELKECVLSFGRPSGWGENWNVFSWWSWQAYAFLKVVSATISSIANINDLWNLFEGVPRKEQHYSAFEMLCGLVFGVGVGGGGDYYKKHRPLVPANSGSEHNSIQCHIPRHYLTHYGLLVLKK